MIWKLRYHPIAQVKFLDAVTMKKFADMVLEREPLVSNIIGFMDGVSFPTECTDERVKQRGRLYVQPMKLYVFQYLFLPIPTSKTLFFSLDMVFFSIFSIPFIPICKSVLGSKKTVKCSVPMV